jgi:hypothetical protein
MPGEGRDHLYALTTPHPEERAIARVSKDEGVLMVRDALASLALLTMRLE